MASVSEKDGIDLVRELDNYEQVLISAGFLADKSAEAYRAIYEKGARGEELIPPDYDPQFLDMFSFAPCYFMMVKQTGSSELKFMKIWMQMQQSGANDTKTQCEIILDNLSVEEFEIPFYRMVSLYSIYSFNKKGLEIPSSK